MGVINAAPALFGLLSAWAADPVNQLLGRRGTIFATNLFVVFPVLAQGFAKNWVDLMICRLFMGIGMGIKISTIPVYSAEVAPASIRGAIVTSFQLYVAFGILVGFSSNLIFMNIGRLAWRFQLAAAFVPAVPLMALIWLCPESPRWLMKKEDISKRIELSTVSGTRSSSLLESSSTLIAKSWLRPRSSVASHSAEECWSFSQYHESDVRRSLPRLLLSLSSSLVSWQIEVKPTIQANPDPGINIMAFYSSTIFQEAGYSVKQSLLASFGFVRRQMSDMV